MDDTYESDFKEVKEKNLIWILIIGSENCPPCLNLENSAKLRGIKVTKITPDHPQAKILNKMYEDKGYGKVTGWPDWLVIRYENNKLTYAKRLLGFGLKISLDEELKKAKNGRGISYKKVN